MKTRIRALYAFHIGPGEWRVRIYRDGWRGRDYVIRKGSRFDRLAALVQGMIHEGRRMPYTLLMGSGWGVIFMD